MEKFRYMLFVISLGIALMTSLSYGILHINLSLGFATSFMINARDFLLTFLYIFFFITLLDGFIYYKFLIK